MSVKKAQHARDKGEKAGDCIDCLQCIAVCPTGVDIRKGSQLGCIQCGLCIDACDNVMKEIGRAPHLIYYDTDINVQRRAARQAADLPADPAAHPDLSGDDGAGRLGHDRTSSRRAPISASMSCTTAIRSPCRWPTAACATAIRCGCSTSRPTTARSISRSPARPACNCRSWATRRRQTVTVGPDQTLEFRVLVIAPPGGIAVGGHSGHIHCAGRQWAGESQRLRSLLPEMT